MAKSIAQLSNELQDAIALAKITESKSDRAAVDRIQQELHNHPSTRAAARSVSGGGATSGNRWRRA